jgi:signal peptide peptidase SppA
VFDTPLLILPEKLEVIATYLLERQAGKISKTTALGISQDKYNNNLSTRLQSSVSRVLTSGAAVVDGIAVIPVLGTLVYRGGLNPISKMTTYASLQNKIQEAVEAPDVSSILLDINSPGGEANGVFDLADYIYSVRSKKKIVAVANEVATSGAYLIASAASRVFLSRTASVGSIGVIMIHKDISEALKRDGVKITAIYEGSHKIDLAPFEPLTENARERAQITVGCIYDLFVNTVARNRNITQKQVKGTEAAIYMGEEALNGKLADKIMTTRAVFESLRALKNGGKNKMYVSNINIPIEAENLEADLETIGNIEIPTKVESSVVVTPVSTPLPVLPIEPVSPPVPSSSILAIKAERERINALYAICDKFGCTASFLSFVNKGISIDLAKEVVSLAMSAKETIPPVNVSANGNQAQKENPLISNAKKRQAGLV